MKTVNIGKLKDNLSAYLQDVRNGEEVIVQDRKKPIARIVPIRTTNISEQEAELAAKGILKLPEEEMDWDAFWRLPTGDIQREVAIEAANWAKGNR